jgi:hypothetical protein
LLSYLVQKWAFARRFESFEGGYLYRQSLGAPAYFVSEAERAESLMVFKGRYWRWSLSILAVMFAAVLLIAIAAMFVDTENRAAFLNASSFVIVGLMLIATWVMFRQLHAIPVRNLANREPILPARSLGSAWREKMTKRSWPVHIAIGFYILALAWLFFPGLEPQWDDWYLWIYGLVAALLVTQWGWIGWHKIKQN